MTVSAFTAGQVEALLGFPRSRIRVVHHGVMNRAASSPNARENVVLCVGAIQRRKNQAALVRAFRAMPSDWSLVLAGSQGYEAVRPSREIERSPCASRIHITGYLHEAEIAKWYGRARIFAFPSLDEGFGMPVLEAMAAGVPVIAANRSAMPEVAGDAALLIDPASDDELESALQLLATDFALRDQLIDKGQKRVAQFNWPRAVRETIDVYRELTAG